MIPFFRKIRKKMADDNKPMKYMRYAIGEIVLVVTGSSSRLTAMTKDRPTDATIQAIIDFIVINGKETYKK